MGSFAPRGHAKLNPRHPAAFAICDCCGFLYNHRDLRPQVQWMGNQLQRTGYLHCPTCFDQPNQTLRPIVLPPDPVPILNPRPDLNPVNMATEGVDPRGDTDIMSEDRRPIITEIGENLVIGATDSQLMLAEGTHQDGFFIVLEGQATG